MKLDNTLEAILDYTYAHEMNPKSIDPLLLRAKARISRMEYPQAVQDFSRVLEIDKKNTDALYNRACLMFEMGQKDAACEDWRASMSLGKTESVKWVSQFCKP
jgi:tetratricopeptide (TPR) repeat protein